MVSVSAQQPVSLTQQDSTAFSPQQIAIQTTHNAQLIAASICILLIGFVALAYDVNSPSSLHFFAEIDLTVHEWVVENTPSTQNSLAKAMSNQPIAVAGVGWLAASALIVARGDWASKRRVLLCWIAYVVGGGVIRHGDPLLVHFLKELYGRARPSTLHVTHSFPSGHTTAAFFLWGSLLLVLLPQLVPAAKRWPVLSVWLLSGVCVAAGRVLLDVHWLTGNAVKHALPWHCNE